MISLTGSSESGCPPRLPETHNLRRRLGRQQPIILARVSPKEEADQASNGEMLDVCCSVLNARGVWRAKAAGSVYEHRNGETIHRSMAGKEGTWGEERWEKNPALCICAYPCANAADAGVEYGTYRIHVRWSNRSPWL